MIKSPREIAHDIIRKHAAGVSLQDGEVLIIPGNDLSEDIARALTREQQRCAMLARLIGGYELAWGRSRVGEEIARVIETLHAANRTH